MLLGRPLLEEDARPEAPAVAVMGYGYWQLRFGGDPEVVGRTIPLRTGAVTIVGVTPPDFKVASFEPALWSPFRPPAGAGRGNGDVTRVIGRLREGVSIRQAREQMNAIAAQLAAEYPNTNSTRPRATVLSLRDEIIGAGVGDSLFLLFGATGVVLLIASVNLANLLLAHASERRHEMAVRAALGATRWRLLRLVLLRSALVTFAGGILGVGVLMAGRRALIATMPYQMPRTDAIHVDWRVLAFACGVAAVTALVAGLLPAWRASSARPAPILGESAGAGLGRRRLRLSSFLVTAESTLAVVVLAAAALLVGSYLHLSAVDPGFDPRGAAMLRLRSVDAGRNPGAEARLMLQELAGIPGVAAVAAIDTLPLGGGRSSYSYSIPGRPDSAGSRPTIDLRKITPGYFRAMGIPIRQGRDFTSSEDERARMTAIVNELTARTLWPGQPALGQQIKLSGHPDATVVGVVGSVRHSDLASEALPEIYVPYFRRSSGATYVVRAAGRPADLFAALTARAEAVSGRTVSELRTLDDVVIRSIHVPRFRAFLFGLMGLLVVVLTAVGVLGVTAHAVVQRRREIGIRVALGAQRRQVLRLVIGQAATPALAGVALGVIVAVNTNRLVGRFLYGTAPTDLATFGVVTALVTATALFAAYLPARRATCVDPAVVLRKTS
jgi:predicted permease